MKYFSAFNNAGGQVPGVAFETVDIVANAAFGVYATENPAIIATLEALKPTTSIVEISQNDYEVALKKKHPRFKDSMQSDPMPSALPGVAIQGSGAVVVQNSEPVEAEVTMPATTVATVEEALVVAPTNAESAPTPAPTPEPVGRRISRGNR